MASWTTKKLKDITTKIGSGATPRGGRGAYHEVGTPLIRSLNIYDLNFTYDNLAFIDASQAKQLENVTVEKDDVLLNITGASVCRCTSVPDNLLPARVNQHVSIIRADRKNLFGKYLKYALVSPLYKRALYGLATTGATREALTKSDIESFEIKLPDIETQTHIASILSAYDDQIENNEKRIKALEEMAQLLYTEWLVNFKFPGHEKVKMVESGTEYGMIPKDWEIKKFGEIIELTYGKALKGGNRTEGNILVYGSSGLVGTHNEKLVKGPGIVVGRKGNAGAVHWVDNDFYPIDTTYYVKSNLNLHFVYYLLKNHDFVTGDVAVPGLNRNQTYLSAILLPPAPLITEFSARVSHVFNLVSFLSKKNLRLEKMRDLLIPQLVTGRKLLK